MELLHKVVYSTIALVVMVLIISLVAIPVVQSAMMDQTESIDNENEKFAAITMDDTSTVVITKIAGTAGVTVNDVPVDIGINYHPVIIADSFVVVYDNQNADFLTVYALDQIYGPSSSRTASVTLSGGTCVYTNLSSTSVTLEYEWCFYPSNDGTYGMFGSDANVNIDRDKTAYIIGYRFVTSPREIERTLGTLTNNVYTNLYTKMETSATMYTGTSVLDITSVKTEFGYEYTDRSLTASFTVGDEPVDVTLTGSNSQIMILAPLGYTVLKDGSMVYQLLGLLPLLLLLVPVFATVRILYFRGD